MAYTRLFDANEITERYMDSILIEERLIDSVKADLKTTILGETFDTPVMTPAFSHLTTASSPVLKSIQLPQRNAMPLISAV